ncbi:copper resistance D family protein [Halogranum amylolyticum]|nr:CopD family protein [Halogranum amylolyticum]
MTPLEPAFRALLVTALMILVGVPPTLLAAVLPVLRRRGVETTTVRRIALLFVGPSLVAAVVSVTTLTALKWEPSVAGVDTGVFVSAALGTEPGIVWLVQATLGLGLIALTVAVARDTRWVTQRRWLATVTAGSLTMLAVFCWTRYSTAVSSRELAVFVKWVHMTGAALWVGGLFVMARLSSFFPEESDADLDAIVAAFIRRFSLLAVAGVTIAFVTGILITSWHVPSVDALLTTPYGLVVVAKVGLVLGAAGLGGFNRLVLHGLIQGTDDRRSREALPGLLVLDRRFRARDAVRSFVTAVRVELAVLVVALLASVVLTAVFQPSYTVVDIAPRQVFLTAAGSAASNVLFFSPLVQPLSTWFAEMLQLGAIAVAIVGSLALGYELGEFGAHRR